MVIHLVGRDIAIITKYINVIMYNMGNNIQHAQEHSGGIFYYTNGGNRVGEMHYRMLGQDKMIIDHTEVDEKMEGHGIGKNLLEALVKYVRENKIKVIPRCSFAQVTFQRMKEWQDVLIN
jgi:predicted GNAT family acetyltransferase